MSGTNIRVIIFVLLLSACNESEIQISKPLDNSSRIKALSAGSTSGSFSNKNIALYKAEYLASSEYGNVGRTVYYKNVGQKRLEADFAPGASLDGNDEISYYVDPSRPSDELQVASTTAAIDGAMSSWDAVKCSTLGINKILPEANSETGFISSLYGFGGNEYYVADIVHCGWMPGEFFDTIDENGSTFILGVTFTIISTDDNGVPLDVDQNGLLDVAWREIYYNDAFSWSIGGGDYDVATIALHEAGHGLSQAHFGKAFFNNRTEELQFSPRAIMNASYSGVQQEIQHTDLAGHCSNWASWPSK
jgi:hypothetical protein